MESYRGILIQRYTYVILFIYSCVRQDWPGYAVVTSTTQISLAYYSKHTTYMLRWLQLCSGIQAEGAAPIWNITSLVAEGKEKMVGHKLAPQTPTQK